MRANLIAFVAGMLSLCIAGTTAALEAQARGRTHSQTKTIRWDRSTLTLIAERAGYGRMIRLTGNLSGLTMRANGQLDDFRREP